MLKTLFNPSIGFGRRVSVESSLTRATGIWVGYALGQISRASLRTRCRALHEPAPSNLTSAVSSELRKLARAARPLGFRVEPRSRHDLWRAPDGHMETVGRTPSRRTISMLLTWIEEHQRRA